LELRGEDPTAWQLVLQFQRSSTFRKRTQKTYPLECNIFRCWSEISPDGRGGRQCAKRESKTFNREPAVVAHTLNIPAPLIKIADSHLRGVLGGQHSEVVVLLTLELMYFENRPNDPLGSGRVFLEIPYAQASGFFGNLTTVNLKPWGAAASR
jgi:hypothetical protein